MKFRRSLDRVNPVGMALAIAALVCMLAGVLLASPEVRAASLPAAVVLMSGSGAGIAELLSFTGIVLGLVALRLALGGVRLTAHPPATRERARLVIDEDAMYVPRH